MGERRPKTEREYNPLDDVSSLIGNVLSKTASEEPQEKESREEPVSKIVPLKTIEEPKLENAPTPVKDTSPTAEMVVCKFKVPKSEYKEIKRILSEIGDVLGARVDVSHLGRGWITRMLTAETELLNAARNQEPLKTPNSRDPLAIAEVDHAMAKIQSVGFRRAKPIGN